MGRSLRIVHASGNTFMSLVKTKQDVKQFLLLKPAPLWITVTEAADPETIRALSRAVRETKSPYNVMNPDNGDIAFLIHHDARIVHFGGPLVVKAQPGPAREGGHGPRRNSWVQLHWKGEVLFANGCHFVTRVIHGEHHHTREEQQVLQAGLLGRQMKDQASGRDLAIGSGDLNGSLPDREDLQAIFDEFRMTTTAKETGDSTPTHDNARIDYVWTMDKDHRLSVDDMHVLKSPTINSDHDPIVVDLTIS